MSEEVIPSYLDFFKARPQLLTVGKSKFEKITTKTSIREGNLPNVLEFTAGADKEYCTDLTDTWFMLVCRYVRADGNDIDETDQVAPVQNLVGSVIRSIDQHINDVRTSPLEDNAAYIQFIQEFWQSPGAKGSYQTLSLWYDDTYTTYDTANQADPTILDPPPPAAPVANRGLRKRHRLFVGDKELVLFTKLYIPSHTADKLIPTNCKIDWRLHTNKYAFFTMSSQPQGNYKFFVADAQMLVKRVLVAPSLMMSQAKALQSGRNIIYNTNYLLSRDLEVARGLLQFKFPNVFIGKDMPIALFVGFVDSEAHKGELTKNPYVFEHTNVSKITCHLGGRQVPEVDYELNFDISKTSFAYWQSLKALDIIGSNGGPINFNRETFENGLAIYGFDLSRDSNPAAFYGNSAFDATTLSIEGVFNVATPKTYTMIVFGLFQAQFEIDQFMKPYTPNWS